MNKKCLFVDMDGVLCEYHTDVSPKQLMAKGYFSSLKPREKTLQAVKGLLAYPEYDIFILSSVIKECCEQSKAEKNEWLNKYLPEIPHNHRIFPLCGSDKAAAVKNIGKNDILIDDHSPNLFLWTKAGGTGIKVLNECNGLKGSFDKGPRLKIDNINVLLKALQNL